MDTLVGLVSIAGFILFLLLLVLCSYELRRWKYRQIADELQAEYQSQGLFKAGKIAGASNHRKYTIENVVWGRATWTTVEMPCLNKGIPLHLHGHFFKEFPNWKYAFTMGDRTERVFITHITLQNVGIPLEEKYRIEVQGLFQETAQLNSSLLREGLISIDKETISFKVNGTLKKLEVIQQILSILTGVADRIESAPIV
jgi:hypothetical protein